MPPTGTAHDDAAISNLGCRPVLSASPLLRRSSWTPRCHRNHDGPRARRFQVAWSPKVGA